MKQLRLIAGVVVLVAIFAAQSSHAANEAITVTMSVPSATSMNAAACATGTADVTSFGPVLPGTARRTGSDCAIEFGSSNDTAMLRVYQSDGGGDAMRPGPASGSGLLGLWTFDRGLASLDDQSSNANAATLPDASQQPVEVAGPPGFGQALDFDGNNDTISIPYLPAYDIASLTVDAWMKAPSSETAGYVATRGTGTCSLAGLCSWAIWIDHSGRMEIDVERGGSELTLNTGIDVTDNSWHHVAFSIDGSNVLRAYIDGIERGSRTLGGPIDLGVGAIWVGRDAVNDVGARFDGSVDELRLTAGAASPDAIRSWAQSRVRDYADGSHDWDTASAGFFGGCLAAVSNGATTGAGTWTASAGCSTSDGAWWNPILPAGSAGSMVARAPLGDTDARAQLRFGVRTLPAQLPGSYEAPLTFEVIAPATAT